ncbi:Piwi domain-containing protein [Fomitopsis betulina]|nr:Piwi domain-containing protein [Fomitopsis betulina]
MSIQSRPGRPMHAKTNSFLITRGPKSQEPWYQYDVVIDIQLDRVPPRRAFEIIDKLQLSHPQHFNPRAVYDGKRNLFSKNGNIPSSTLEVNMSSRPNSAKGIIKVKLARSREITADMIEKLMKRGGGSDEHTDTSATSLLQIVVRHGANIRHHYPPSARAFFVEHGSRDMSGGLRAYRGFFQSVRPTIGRLLLNVDTVTALLYQPGSLVDLAKSYMRRSDVRALERLSSADLNRLRGFLKGVRVRFVHARTDRARPISGLVPDGGGYGFEKDGAPTTVEEYFRQVYNKRLQFPRLFGVRIGRDNIFPAELCVVEPGQLYRKKVPAELGPDFLKFSTQRPHDKLKTIEAAITGQSQLFDYAVSDFMREAGLSVGTQPLRVNGRVLPTPGIQYNGEPPFNPPERSGAWNVVRKQLLKPCNIVSWAVVVFDSGAREETVGAFVKMLNKNMRLLGMTVQNDAIIERGNPHRVWDSLDATAKKAFIGQNPPTFVLVFLPSSAAEIRRDVKHWGDIRRHVPTQCLRAGKWERLSDQYCNNVALKINGRIGGVNSKVHTTAPDLQTIVPPGTMVVGADVGHPGPGMGNRPSMTGLVASLNVDCTDYAAFSSIQQPRLERIEALEEMFKLAIYEFLVKNNGRYPARFVFFRDGVSEGEYAETAKSEIEVLNECLKNLVAFDRDGKPNSTGAKAYRPERVPPLTFIVVGKRHHVRFFPMSPADGDRSGNCPPGFVVDGDIVSPSYPNFYLQSHSGIQGTSRPSHYIVLHNGIEMSLDQCQRLAFELCHVYASATRSVSIPAPVYYADRVCARAEFHFPPEKRFADSESGVGSGSEPPFDIEEWKTSFQTVPAGKMYFL